jgi:Lon protease-like protein
MADDVPMFPLGTVLVPGAYLPLHVFEPRYRALVQACLAGTPEFGVALIERGSEVGGGDQRFSTGCVARIVEAVELEDGRYAIGAVGTRRIRILRWLPDAPYPRAEVEDWPDPDPGPDVAALVASVVPRFRRVLALAAEAGEAVPPATVELSDDPVAVSHEMTALAPLGPLDSLGLLAAPSAEARLRTLDELLEDAATVLASRLGGG